MKGQLAIYACISPVSLSGVPGSNSESLMGGQVGGPKMLSLGALFMF